MLTGEIFRTLLHYGNASVIASFGQRKLPCSKSRLYTVSLFPINFLLKRKFSSYYFDLLLRKINEDDILYKWYEAVSELENLSPEAMSMYELKIFNDT